MTTSQQLVKEVIERHPGCSTHMLARILYDSYTETWPTFNAARQAVRRARGASGNAQRHLATHPRPLVNPADLANPFNLPEAEEMPYPIIDLPGSRFLVISDIHIPYHDLSALTLAIKEGQRFNVDHILINGDLLDFYSLSRFDKDPRSRSFASELRSGRAFFEALKGSFPKSEITLKVGNHEERYSKYLLSKAPELLDLPGMTLQDFMKLEELGVKVVDDRLRLMIGKLFVIHGHEFPSGISAPVNPARGAYLKAAESVIVGHLHRTSQHSETTISGKVVSTWSTGCLCQLHPHYCRLNKWNSGYALVEVDGSGAFQVENYRIVDGKSWR